MKLERSVALFAMFASGGAMAAGGVCSTDQDCEKGEFCAATPCLPPNCDPSDPSCEVPECPSYCTPTPDNGGGSNDGCQSDADCPAGMACGVMGSMGTACACPDGAPDCGCDEPGAPVEYKGCMPKECTSDADCGGDLECVTYERPCATTAIDCAPGQECPDPVPCEPVKSSQCLPKWAGTCDVDADCGDGFTCKAYEQCSCSGSSGGGSAGSSGGAAPPSEPTDPADEGDASSGAAEMPAAPCTCEPSTDKYCEPVKKTCTTDSECPSDWKCESFQTGSGSATSSNGTSTPASTDDEAGTDSNSGSGSSGSSGDSDAGPACAEGQSCDAADPPAGAPVAPPTESWCVPPYYSDYAEAGALPPTGPMAEGEAFPSRDGSGGGSNNDSTGGTDGSDGTTNVPKDTGSSSSSKGASAGCTMDQKGSPASLAAIGLALLAAFGLRRRA